jgi:carbon-monoxide dehydrogenase large subunit
VRHSDTALFAFGEGTSASRGLIVGGSAVYTVAQEARRHLAHLASELLGCRAEDIDLRNGLACNRHQPEETLTLPQLVAASDPASEAGAGDRGLVFSATYTLPDAPFSFGAHAVVVEICRDTGQVTIRRYVGVHDCGRIVNPRLVEGQIIGGIAQGLGQALSEDVVYNSLGQPLTGSLMDYAMPKAREVPALILETLEVPSPTNPLGAKGIGSVSTVPAPAAVTNAVLDALSGFGVRHLDTPLTAEKIWRAMQGLGQQRGDEQNLHTTA